MPEMEEGVSMAAASCDRNWAVRMKNVSSRKATSHIAVISTVELARFILTAGIVELSFCPPGVYRADLSTG